MSLEEILSHYKTILIALEKASDIQLHSSQPNQIIQHSTKKDGSVITEIDLLSEQIILDAIKKSFPHDSIHSEEQGFFEPNHSENKKRIWFVDPLDGTASFLEGLPHFGPTLALVEDDKIIFAALFLPKINERWVVIPKFGVYSLISKGNEHFQAIKHIDPKRLTRSSQGLNHRSVLYVPSQFHLFAQTKWPGKIRSLGSLSAHLFYTAIGRSDCVIVPSRWQEWDVAAGFSALFAEQRYLFQPSLHPDSKHSSGSFSRVSDLFSSINTKKSLPVIFGNKHAVQFFTTPSSIKLLNI